MRGSTASKVGWAFLLIFVIYACGATGTMPRGSGRFHAYGWDWPLRMLGYSREPAVSSESGQLPSAAMLQGTWQFYGRDDNQGHIFQMTLRQTPGTEGGSLLGAVDGERSDDAATWSLNGSRLDITLFVPPDSTGRPTTIDNPMEVLAYSGDQLTVKYDTDGSVYEWHRV